MTGVTLKSMILSSPLLNFMYLNKSGKLDLARLILAYFEIVSKAKIILFLRSSTFNFVLRIASYPRKRMVITFNDDHSRSTEEKKLELLGVNIG